MAWLPELWLELLVGLFETLRGHGKVVGAGTATSGRFRSPRYLEVVAAAVVVVVVRVVVAVVVASVVVELVVSTS